MRKIFSILAALMLSVGLWAQETSKQDTVRIFNDILTVDEIYHPISWEQVGWMYSTHDEGESYISIRTNQLDKFGTFTVEAGTIDTAKYYNLTRFEDTGDTTRISFVSGSATVAEIGDSIIFDGDFLADDGKVYLFHCTHLTKALNYDTDIPLNAEFEYFEMSYYLDNGIINIEANNLGYTLNLELYANPEATKIPEGTYTISDTQEAGTARLSVGVENFEPQYCYAATMDNVAGIMRDFWFLVEGSVTLSYDEYGKLNVTVDAKNSYNQDGHMNIKYNYVEPIDTITLEEEISFEIAPMPMKDNIYLAQAYSGYYPIAIFAIKTDTISGDFTALMDLPGCAFRSPETGFIYAIREIENYVVTQDGKKLFLETSFLAGDSIQYILKGAGYVGGLAADCIIHDFDGVFENESVVCLTDGSRFELKAQNDQFEEMDIFVTCSHTQDSVLVPGTYPVYQSSGLTEKGPTPSYVYNNDYIWFIQSGNLIVNEDGSMSLEGVNSCERTVKLTVTAKKTDLMNVNENVNVNKYIKNGQLYIRKGDKTYNVLGTRL